MPLKKCTKDGKSGWQYGSGTCYVGSDAKKRALRQMAAIKANASEIIEELTKDELDELLGDGEMPIGLRLEIAQKLNSQ